MQAFGWRISLPDGEMRARALSEIPRLCCEHLNLCAGVGCQCAVGGEADRLCYEERIGARVATIHMDGPEWIIRISEYPEAVAVSIALHRPAVGREIDALYRAISQACPGRAIHAISVTL